MIRLMLLVVISWLAGCGSSPPAPVVERGGAPVPAAPPALAAPALPVAVEAKPGFYVVKKSDTLYSIALEHGQTYRDVAAWNKLEDPSKIQIGQQLRVVPPEGETPVAETRPVQMPTSVEVRSLSGAAIVAGTGELKREPKGGKLPYSEQALAQLQRIDITPPVAVAKPPDKPVDIPIPPPAVSADTLDWVWPSSAKVTANFVEGSNKGVDISAKSGEPVLAAAAGKVVYVGTGIRGYGKLVIIKHNASFLSVYAHNSQILVKEEQTVTKAQKIAEVGSTDSDQPMLHFEIRHLNRPVDPLKYLPSRP